jgi:hypothetical protein
MSRPLRWRAGVALFAACLAAQGAVAQGLPDAAPAAQAPPPKAGLRGPLEGALEGALERPVEKPEAAPSLYAEFLRTDDLDLAAGAARRLILDGMEPQVLRTPSGALAVVAGPTPVADPQSETLRLKEERSPIPLRYAPPSDYGAPVVWRRPADVLAGLDYRRGEPARLTYGDLVVDVTQRRGPTGRPAPVAIGRVGGRVVFATPPREDAERAPFGQVRLIRLDPAARHPAVVLTAYTGGMHCCTVTTIAAEQGDGRWSLAQGRRLDADGYEFEDVDGDGVVELVSLDNSFLYAFTSYVGSFAPPRLSRLEGGRLVDVTRRPAMRGFLRQSVQALEFGRTPEQWRENGFLAGWVATRSLLGEGHAAWAAMEPLHQEFSMMTPELCPDGSLDGCPEARKRRVPFKEAFAAHLRANGYPLDPPPRAAGGAIVVAPGVAATSLPGLAACSALTLWPKDGPPAPARVAAQTGGLTLLRAPTLKAAPAALGPSTAGDADTAAKAEAIWLAARPDAPAQAVRGALAGPRDEASGGVLVGGPILNARGAVVALMGPQGEAIPLGQALAALGVAPRPARAAPSPHALAARLATTAVMVECAP